MKIHGGETDAVLATDRTRDAVARTVLERGPQTAADLAGRLGLSAAAIRRHLDALVADGLLVERLPRPAASRGRGRPARTYALTDAGRAAFPHGYDDLASTALHYLRDTGGEQAVVAFAEHRAARLAAQLADRIDTTAPLTSRTEALAGGLSAHGYASTTRAAGLSGPALSRTASSETATPATSGPAAVQTGVQICQHHCPVAHVAAEFPQLCEAETRAFEQVLGTYVQRLATIAHGDGVCTTHVPVALPGTRTPAEASTPPASARPVTETPATRSGRTLI